MAMITNEQLRALGFLPDSFDSGKWNLCLRDVTERPDRNSDILGRAVVVWPSDGGCCLTEFDRDGETVEMVGLPTADADWLGRLVALLTVPEKVPDRMAVTGKNTEIGEKMKPPSDITSASSENLTEVLTGSMWLPEIDKAQMLAELLLRCAKSLEAELLLRCAKSLEAEAVQVIAMPADEIRTAVSSALWRAAQRIRSGGLQ